MRHLCIVQFLLLLSVIAAQHHGSSFQFPSSSRRRPSGNRRTSVNRRTGNNSPDRLASLLESELAASSIDQEPKTGISGGNPNIFGSHDPSNCFCIPKNQVCDSNGQVPRTATRINKITTRIVNTNPASICPEERKPCCFSGTGPRPSVPTPAPILGNSCGTRKSLAQALPGTAHADFGEYPWNVAITTPNNDFVSTGALVSPDFVLTAAHSIRNKGSNLLVRLGDYDLGDENELPQYPHQIVGVTQIIVHPGFNSRNLFNDVALLRLQSHVSYTPHIRPVCLPERGQRFDGARCWVAGFGEDEHQQFSRIIREVDVPILDGIDCEAALLSTNELTQQFKLNTESFVCAGGEEGKDACRGDGGAPLVCEEFNTGKFTVVGLVAWGLKTCGRPGIPGVYVNVASFSDFIGQYVPIIF